MGIDQAVRHVDREIRTARAALAKAAERTGRVAREYERAKADEAIKRAEVDRLVSANALLTGKAEPKRGRTGAPPGENPRHYEQFLAAVEHMDKGSTRAELRATLGIAQATMDKYLKRAVREGRLTVSERRRANSPVLVRNDQIIDISMRRSA